MLEATGLRNQGASYTHQVIFSQSYLLVFFYSTINLCETREIRKVKDAIAFTSLRREISPVTPWQLYTAFV